MSVDKSHATSNVQIVFNDMKEMWTHIHIYVGSCKHAQQNQISKQNDKYGHEYLFALFLLYWY